MVPAYTLKNYSLFSAKISDMYSNKLLKCRKEEVWVDRRIVMGMAVECIMSEKGMTMYPIPEILQINREY